MLQDPEHDLPALSLVWGVPILRQLNSLPESPFVSAQTPSAICLKQAVLVRVLLLGRDTMAIATLLKKEHLIGTG